jgi:ATP-dependent RNA helicase DDX49/DBP8
MGFKRPTPIQQACINAIIRGKDVMGCAETGSGKTAAFALPMLHHLSQDPYGVFGVILTPTRELALQIQEQIKALGAPMNVTTTLIIGGASIIDQSLALSRRPHFIIATPGRLRHHMESADPPFVSKARFLVLDEADRLLSAGFESDLEVILNHMNSPLRQTLLFSATLTSSLAELDKVVTEETLRFDLTKSQQIPATLTEQYIFIPSQVKLCYLVALLNKVIAMSIVKTSDVALGVQDEDAGAMITDMQRSSHKKKLYKKNKLITNKKSPSDSDNSSVSSQSSSSIIIFTNTCKRCQLIAELLLELKIDCVALHSMMSQHKRSASLGKFKSQVTKILVATDVASRGLDIPQVDLVINLDLPRISTDYIHRVGRTARAGRRGRCISLVTPQEVDLVHSIEECTQSAMVLSSDVTDDDVIPLLNTVSNAMKSAQLRLMEVGFDEHAEEILKRKKKQKRKLLRKRIKSDSGDVL